MHNYWGITTFYIAEYLGIMSGILLVGLHCLGLHNFQILWGINRGLLEGSVVHLRSSKLRARTKI